MECLKMSCVLFTVTALLYIPIIISFGTNEKCGLESKEYVHTYSLNISKVLHNCSKHFLSFSIDSQQIRRGFQKPSLKNPELVRLVSYLASGYLRIGGNEADRLVFKEDNAIPESTLNPNETFFMSDRQWMEICTFANRSGLKMLFDLNVLLRNGLQWDYSNAKELLDFSASKGLDIDWQLGNEPNSFPHQFNMTVSPTQLAKDFITLRALLNSYPVYLRAVLAGPDVTSVHRSVEAVNIPADRFLHKFTESGGTEAVSAVTWHHYYLHRNATLADFLSPVTFNSLKMAIDVVKNAVKKPGKPIWITESGSASGGGIAGVTDMFIASFLFLDRLGLAAKEGVDVVVRQSLYAGHYSLLDHETLTPNPDWWISYIYKRLVALTVLSIEPTSQAPDTLRLYAHCSHDRTVVVFGLNLSNATEHLLIKSEASPSTAQLYQFTASQLLSRDVMLNNSPLRLPADSPPQLQPVLVNAESVLSLSPHSIFFLHFDSLHSHLCSAS